MPSTSITMGLLEQGVPLRLLFDLVWDVDAAELLDSEDPTVPSLTQREMCA